MDYISTRGNGGRLAFDDVLLAGLSPDGGLYLPDEWPQFTADDLRALAGKPYEDVAFTIMQPFVGDSIAPDDFRALIDTAYDSFFHRARTPLRQMDSGLWLLELFHGPTLAFKDVALQLLGRLFDHVLSARGARATIIGATSGDTGSAAIAGCRGLDAVDIFILHPHGRVSEVQRRQMTTVMDANVHNIAIEGSFDDCQALVKAMFNDTAFRKDLALAAINSINWARIMAQIVYYVHSALSLGAPGRRVAFSVPTGNFGDVFAGYAAHRMGLSVERLMVATNRNDILARMVATGRYECRDVMATISPSMDIQVSSNFERLLFEMHDGDAGAVSAMMNSLAQSGAFDIDDAAMARLRELFDARRVDEEETLAEIARCARDHGGVVDPHSAVGLAAARQMALDEDVAVISLATAHPAKFADAVEKASGIRPPLPEHLSDLMGRPERYDVLDNDPEIVKRYVRERARIVR